MDLYFLYMGIFIIAIFIIVVWIMWSSLIGAGFEPTSMNRVKKMLDIAEIGPEDVLYDLGSGDGRIVSEAVKSYGARAVGIEADPIRVFWSRIFLFYHGIHPKSKIKWGNLFNEEIFEATALTLFLGGKANEKLKDKLVNELKPGTPVVSYFWKFNDWKPIKIDKEDRIYLYIIGVSNK